MGITPSSGLMKAESLTEVRDAPAPDTSSAAPVNTTAQAYDVIRRAIINAELKPGAIVSQVQLAAQLDISRTPLREALRRLQSEGLLEGDFNRRLRVASLSVADLEQVAAMRIVLETLGVQISVPRLDTRQLEQATKAFEDMDKAWLSTTTSSFDDFRIPHRIFHTTLFSGAGTRIRCQLEELWDHAERYRTFYRQSANNALELAHIAHDEHEAILRSAHERNARECGKLTAVHLARTALTTLAKLDPTHDPAVIRQATLLAAGED
ncbi:GntR family transcriptional regulator [Mycolicibacterium sp. CBM1]